MKYNKYTRTDGVEIATYIIGNERYDSLPQGVKDIVNQLCYDPGDGLKMRRMPMNDAVEIRVIANPIEIMDKLIGE